MSTLVSWDSTWRRYIQLQVFSKLSGNISRLVILILLICHFSQRLTEKLESGGLYRQVSYILDPGHLPNTCLIFLYEVHAYFNGFKCFSLSLLLHTNKNIFWFQLSGGDRWLLGTGPTLPIEWCFYTGTSKASTGTWGQIAIGVVTDD